VIIQSTSIRCTVSVRPALLTAVVFACGGCALPSAQATSDPAPEREGIAESSSPVVIGSWTDWSGTVTVTLHACPASSPNTTPAAGCTVPEDQMLVGGGGNINNDTTAFMTASYPLDGLRTWWFGSRSMTGVSHTVHPYAIGLSLTGISGSQLRSMAILKKLDSPTASHPEVLLPVDPGYVMVGGGAFVSTNQYLVSSFAPNATNWYARSKDHGTAAAGKVQALLIELPVHPNGFWGNIANKIETSSPATVATGLAINYKRPSAGYAMTSIGGAEFFNGAGRMLQGLYPVKIGNNGECSDVSRDAFWQDSGALYCGVVSIYGTF
jgi:hypothetical protein